MIIAPSRGILKELKPCLEGVEIPLAWIPNVVDLRRVPPPTASERISSTGKIVAMGRFVAWKGFDLLLEALSLLPKGSVELHLIGDGPERDSLKRLARELHVSDFTYFHGYLPDPFPLLRGGAFGVLPSRFEPFGNVIIEMFATGLPVIAFDVDYGPREIIRNGMNGFIVRNRNPQHLAEAMSTLLSDRELCGKMGDLAREEVERHYALEPAIRAYEDCFARLQGRSRLPSPDVV
jgi:glycosyltransferase involved in cell wall biosynthesis